MACSKCGEKKLVSQEAQYKALDEGTTTVYQCKNCGNTFSIG